MSTHYPSEREEQQWAMGDMQAKFGARISELEAECTTLRAALAEKERAITALSKPWPIPSGLWDENGRPRAEVPFEHDQGDTLVVWYDDLVEMKEAHEASERWWATALAQAQQERDEKAREIAINDQLLAERQRILDACPCPVHGSCVPHVLAQLAELTRLKGETIP